MKNIKYAFNTHLIPQFITLLFFIHMSVILAVEKEWLLFFLALIFSVIFFIIILIEPFLISFSDEYIRIIYTVGAKEIIPVSKIRKIYKRGSWASRCWPVYVICYPHKTKAWFLSGEIPQTIKTKKLIEHIYGKVK